MNLAQVPPDGWSAFLLLCALMMGAMAVALVAARLLRLDQALRAMLAPRPADHNALILELRLLAEEAARSGISSLVDRAAGIRDPFLAAAVRLTATAEGPDHLKASLDHDLERALAWHDRRSRAVRAVSLLTAILSPLVLGVCGLLLVRTTSSSIPVSLAAGVLGLALLAFAFSSIRMCQTAASDDAPADRALSHILTIAGLVAIKRGFPPAVVESHVRGLLPLPPSVPVRVAA